MPLNDYQAKTIVNLIDSAFFSLRNGEITPVDIEKHSKIFDELIDEAKGITDIPRDLVRSFLIELYRKGILSLRELLQRQPDDHSSIRAHYTTLIKQLFDSGVEDQAPILGELKRFIAEVIEHSSKPSTPQKSAASSDATSPLRQVSTPADKIALSQESLSPSTPESQQKKPPENLQEMLDVLADSLNGFEYYDQKKSTPKKNNANNERKLCSLMRFLTAEAVNNISFEGQDSKLVAYLKALEKLGLLCTQLLKIENLKEVAANNSALQAKIKAKIESIESIEPISVSSPSKSAVKESPDSNKPYVIVKFCREQNRVQAIHDVDSHGHLLIIVNYQDESGAYKNLHATLKVKKIRSPESQKPERQVLEERDVPIEIKGHKWFSKDNVPSGNIFAAHFLSEEEIEKETEELQKNSKHVTSEKEVRIEQEGIDYQKIGNGVAKYLADHYKGSPTPFPYCFYRSNDKYKDMDPGNCASVIYKLMVLGGADKYAELKTEWGHTTPKNVFNFCKDVEAALSKLALLKVDAQTQADFIRTRTANMFIAYKTNLSGKEKQDFECEVLNYKARLDAGIESDILPSLHDLKDADTLIANILKQLYLFASLLEKLPSSKLDELKGDIELYLDGACDYLNESARKFPGKQNDLKTVIDSLIELQKEFSIKHKVVPLSSAIGLARGTVGSELTKHPSDEQVSVMYSAFQNTQKEEERSTVPASQVTDNQVFAAAITSMPDYHEIDEYEQQTFNTLKFINTHIHTEGFTLKDKQTKEKYARIFKVLNYFNFAQKINLSDEKNIKVNLFSASMRIKHVILQIRELKKTPVDGVTESFYNSVIKQLQLVLGEINKLLYFELDQKRDSAKINFNLTSELSVLLGQSVAPLNLEEVLVKARTSIGSDLPPNQPEHVTAKTLKSVPIPEKGLLENLKVWKASEQNWYEEVAAKKEVAAILENKNLSGKQKQQGISKIISYAKPSIFKFWRRQEYKRYTELERQSELICLIEAFTKGEIDEVALFVDLLRHYTQYPDDTRYLKQIDKEGGLVEKVPLLQNIFSQYEENVASLDNFQSSDGTSYSYMQSVLKGDQFTPRSFSDPGNLFYHTSSNLEYLKTRTAHVNPEMEKATVRQTAGNIVREQLAQLVSYRLGM